MLGLKKKAVAYLMVLVLVLSMSGTIVMAEEDNKRIEENQNDSDNTKQGIITKWEWNDPSEELTWSEEKERWELQIPVGTEESSAKISDIEKLLPKAVNVTMEDKTEAEKELVWNLSEFSEQVGEGEYKLTASVGEEITLDEGVQPMEVTAIVLSSAQESSNQKADEQVQESDEQIQALANDKFDKYTIPTVSPRGTTINLFDYWTTGQYAADNDHTMDASIRNLGINKNHELKFSHGTASNEIAANVWTGKNGGSGGPRTGIVQNKLVDGYPMLSTASRRTTGITKEESLDYLFDTNAQDGKAVYENVGGLLQVDEKGYYFYDSSANFASYDSSKNAFKVYEEKAVESAGGSQVEGSFFPFNTAEQVFNIGKRGLEANKNVNSLTSSILHYFGVSMSTRFVQQYGGRTEENGGEDVTYEFSGDDDVWVFIDGVLVADMGGIHDKSSLSINFRTGEIRIDGQRSGTLRSKFQEAGQGNSTGFRGNTFADNTYHTLNFFYLERGNTDSNMKLKYNLVTVPESDVIKVDQLGNPVSGAEFELWEADDDFKTVGDEPLASGKTDSQGVFVLQDENGFLISLKELAVQGKKNFVLRETVSPLGYRSAGDIPLYLYELPDKEVSDGGVLLLSKDYWSNGSYASTKEVATAPDEIYDVNGNRIRMNSDGTLPGTMFSVVLKYSGNGESELADTTKWNPVYGNPVTGWTVLDGHDINAILTAAKQNPYIYTLSSSGAYQNEISNLVGDATKYYFTLGKDQKGETKYTVGHYYTTADSLEEANASNTVRLDSDDMNGEGHESFGREFAANLYVPNIKNKLLVQKLDQAGNALEGATFSLYKEEDVIQDGQIEITSNSPVFDTVKTENIDDGTLTLSGGGVFPTEGKSLTEGTYYLVETSAPEGYRKNDTVTKVVVDATGVYANAGNAEDGVSVNRGVGAIVKSMAQFATNDEIDSTLNSIVVTLETMSGEIPARGWTSTSESMHLIYNPDKANLEYAPTEAGGRASLGIEEGWSKLNIQQCMDHGEGPKTDLGDMTLTRLFSGTVIVRVTNQKIGTLSISKAVEGEDAPDTDEFEFEVLLTDGGGTPVSQTSYSGVKYSDDGTPTDTTVSFDNNGKAKVSLKKGERIEINGLDAGFQYTVTEAAKDGYTTQVSVDEGEVQETNTAQGSIPDNGGSSVAFTNTYSAMESFSFQKINREKDGLSGAGFVLYELTCTDSSHKHDELLRVNSNGDAIESSAVDCWKKVGSVESAEDGMVVFEKLLRQSKEYRLIEYRSPEGYTLPKGQWVLKYSKEHKQFEVAGSIGNPPAFEQISGKETDYQVMNYKPNELPITGNRGIWLFVAIGGALMLFGGGLAGIIRIQMTKKRRL